MTVWGVSTTTVLFCGEDVMISLQFGGLSITCFSAIVCRNCAWARNRWDEGSPLPQSWAGVRSSGRLQKLQRVHPTKRLYRWVRTCWSRLDLDGRFSRIFPCFHLSLMVTTVSRLAIRRVFNWAVSTSCPTKEESAARGSLPCKLQSGQHLFP